jgi:serine/threonine protein kinase
VKAANCLIDDKNNKWRLKICDFGFARTVQKQEDFVDGLTMTYCGSDFWMAPEIYLGAQVRDLQNCHVTLTLVTTNQTIV